MIHNVRVTHTNQSDLSTSHTYHQVDAANGDEAAAMAALLVADGEQKYTISNVVAVPPEDVVAEPETEVLP
jgi:hypothetical protein